MNLDYIIYSILFLGLLWTLRGKPLIKKDSLSATTSLGDAVETKQGLRERKEI